MIIKEEKIGKINENPGVRKSSEVEKKILIK